MNLRKSKKLIALTVAIMLALSFAGCSNQKGKNEGEVSIKIGGWPSETNPTLVQQYDDYLKQMEKKHPNVNIIPDTSGYADSKTFQTKAAAGQLPTAYSTHFTEVKKIIKNGYAADITDVLKKRGLLDAINPDLLATITGDDGKIYAFPSKAYMMGLVMNKELFSKAGLINEDGTVKAPNTYDELVETAKTIKEKTGKAGFAICTTKNCGGWHFMNIAWSHGVKFMEQQKDGSWKATFDTPEAVKALQFIKDLKWKHDVLPDQTVIDQRESQKLFGIGETAMMIDGTTEIYNMTYGMDHSKISLSKLPLGPEGRHVQMGGTVWMFSDKATEEELNAAFDWLELIGIANVELDDETIANKRKDFETKLSDNRTVFPGQALPVWGDKSRVAAEKELINEYTNVDIKDFASYYNITDDVILRTEEPIACQQLYAVLDNCIQEVITNKNADCEELIKTACHDFQVNHLDKQ